MPKNSARKSVILPYNKNKRVRVTFDPAPDKRDFDPNFTVKVTKYASGEIPGRRKAEVIPPSTPSDELRTDFISTAERFLKCRLTENEKDGWQKTALVMIHEQYLKRSQEDNPKSGPEIRKICSEIIQASKKYLRMVKAKEYSLPLFFDDLSICQSAISAVENYCLHADQVLKYLAGTGIVKRGKKRNWARHKYVREMADWYEWVTKKEPRAGLNSPFLNLTQQCFDLIPGEKGLSPRVIRGAVKFYLEHKKSREKHSVNI